MSRDDWVLCPACNCKTRKKIRYDILIEVGFMSNAQKRAQLMTLEYQELLAEAIADGLLNYDNTL